jgi:hypothetical protein
MKRRAIIGFAALSLAIGCGEVSEFAPSGAFEPFVVSYVPVSQTNAGTRQDSRAVAAQFFSGELPAGADGPATTITNRQSAIFPGTLGKKIGGNASIEATAVAIKFKGLGTGYWVVPTTLLDADLKGTILWDAQLAIARDMPTGRQTLLAVASDADGRYGPQTEVPLLVQPLIPPGPVVASLTWDTNADLDLHIVTPDGKTLDPKHPSTAIKVNGMFPPGTGVLDRDSNAACAIDGIRQEDVVWNSYPAPGIYLAKVDMFSACGEPAANFAFRIYIDGVPTEPVAGRLLSIHADNGGPGLALTNFEIQP